MAAHNRVHALDVTTGAASGPAPSSPVLSSSSSPSTPAPTAAAFAVSNTMLARQSTSAFPDDPLGGSAGSIKPSPRTFSTVQLRRSSSISTAIMQGIDQRRKKTNTTVDTAMAAANATNAARRPNPSRVAPELPNGESSMTLRPKRSSIDSARDSSASRTKALSEFNIFLKIMEDVAIHYVTLYFVNMTSSAVITKMEESFAKYYANSQRRLYLRGLAALIGFMISTFAYDYVVLWKNLAITSSVKPVNSSSYVGATRLPKFTLVVGLKVAIVLPVLFLTYYRARKHSYTEDFWLTWICIVIVASYPLAYNKLTNDYGVSWVCLVIMYIYSCTPIRFFPCSVFCLLYLIVYVIVMLAYIPVVSDREVVSNETLYACLFYLLILLPSQSRESAIRVSYMSELMVLLQQEQLKMEEGRSKALLNSMLPQSIVVQLQSGRELIADAYAHATVLFAEVCDFDYYSSKLKPQHVVELLNILFYKFDKLVDVHRVHKVETIGAVYMVVGGCPDPIPNHAELVANLALDMIRCMPEISEKIARKPWGATVKSLNIRIGINSGGLMAGVVGIRNPRFKLFGDTVNVASRMETTNLPGQIQITEATYNILKDTYFTALRGKVFVKGRGDMNTYYLRGRGNFIVPPPAAIHVNSTAATAASTMTDATSPHGSNNLASKPTQQNQTPSDSASSSVGSNDTTGPKSNSGDTQPTTDNNYDTKVDVPAPPVRPPHPGRMTIARNQRRQTMIPSSEGSMSKQNSLVDLLTIATQQQEAQLSPLNPDGSVSMIPRIGLAKANELVAATIAAAPAGSSTTFSTPSVLSMHQRRQTISQLRKNSMRNDVVQKRSIVRENIFDIVEDAEENGDTEDMSGNTEIMKLPKGLTRFEVLFRIHGYGRSQERLTPEAYEFEESYRLENRGRWLRFIRLSVLVFLVLKPFMTLYMTIRLTSNRSFAESHIIFLLNFCVMYPIGILYILCTFSPDFMNWEQSASVFIVLVIAMTMNSESVAANSLGHAYMSVIALYQCYFANISFLLRVANGFTILAIYLVTNLVAAPLLGLHADPDKLRVGRNALYIFIFFAGQAWVVFNSEFKQRINHYREITLNSQKQKLVDEEARITKLLLNLLPETIVYKLKEDPEATIADFFDNVTVLFTDMVNFTAYSSKVSAMELVQFLNDMYTRFDTIAEKENLYKVEIIGDAYFVVGGCPIVSTNNALAVVTAATEMFAVLPYLRRNCGVPDLNIRIGIHSGPVLAGVVGSKDPRYHLFGETVTIAHCLESSGVPGRVHISEATWARMNKDTPAHGFKVEYHTLLSIHGYPKKIRTYFVQ